MIDIRSRIRNLRKARGMSAKDVADRIGISRPFYTQLEGGTRRLSVRYLEGIAGALGSTVEELYSEEGPAILQNGARVRSRGLRSLDVPDLANRLKPFLGEQSAAIAACIDNLQTANRALRREMKGAG